MKTPIPEAMADMVLLNAEEDIEKMKPLVDFVFCAVNMSKAETKALEEAYAKAEILWFPTTPPIEAWTMSLWLCRKSMPIISR